MSQVSLDEWYKIAGIIIAVPVALAFVWGIVRLVSHMMLIHEAIIGRPESDWSDGVPSMVQRFSSQDDLLAQLRAGQVEIDARLIVVEAEFATNGGSSVKDDLNALKAGLACLTPTPRKRAAPVKRAAPR